jgi:rfaE bifunctional protein nucleotidyltransferase chain/domain/rfaE bifunctional protein kinase chain/domain
VSGRASIAVVGDALLDHDVDGAVERVCPDAPAPVVDVRAEWLRPGGAALAAALAAREGADVTLVTAIGRDHAASQLRALLADAGVRVVDLGLRGPTPEKLRVRSGHAALARVDRGGTPAPFGPCPAGTAATIAGARAVLVADYGRGVTADPEIRGHLAAATGLVPIVWDPHPRGAPAVAGVQVVTPNERELAALAAPGAGGPDGLASLTTRARVLAARWRARAVAVTRGAHGAVLTSQGAPPLVVPAPAVDAPDACGAGDCFASAVAGALAAGAVLSEAVEHAVHAAAAFVAAGAASGFTAGAPPRVDPAGLSAADVVARVRADGGTVVATGGCFDLLHAGHVAMLRAARQLGDCLVVLLNDDASVRRLKGGDRPLQPVSDRAAVLAALDCVDAVEVFADDTPARPLARLRPDVFAKGGDYTLDALPETAVLARWGGQVVVLPYLAGRSTTRLLEEAARRAG